MCFKIILALKSIIIWIISILNRISMWPVRYCSGRMSIKIVFCVTFTTVTFSVVMNLANLPNNSLLKTGHFKDLKAALWVLHSFLWHVDSVTTLFLLWRGAYRKPRMPLKIALFWQIPVGFPVNFFTGYLFIEDTLGEELHIRIMTLINISSSLMVRLWIVFVVYNAHQQLTSSTFNMLKDFTEEIKGLKREIICPLDIKIDQSKTKGEGECSNVFESFWKGDKIAVKVYKNSQDIELHMQEAKIRMLAGKHEFIVDFLGVSSSQGGLCMAMELCENGSLDQFLFANRCTFQQLELDAEDDPTVAKVFVGSKLIYVNLEMHGTHSTADLLRISTEIAEGMEYLASKNIIHGDLAARNVLLTSKLKAKLTDFGLSRRLYEYQSYIRLNSSDCHLPWRWMAVEALEDFKFSEKSDVFSYGILLWEIFTLGEIPYKDVPWNPNLVKDLKQGLRLNDPPYAPNFM